MKATLMTLRFVLELCLLAAVVVIAWAAFDSHVVGVIAGVIGVIAVGAVWGVLLSPKRTVDLPLAVRVVIELMLFTAAAAGLWASGFPVAGALLLGAEALVIGGLALLGLPPGASTTVDDWRSVN